MHHLPNIKDQKERIDKACTHFFGRFFATLQNKSWITVLFERNEQ